MRLTSSSTKWITLFSLLFALLGSVELLIPRFLFSLDARFSDWLVRHDARQHAPDPEIVIINIDDISLSQMNGLVGKWTWPRAVYGELIQALHQQGARAIVFDLSFEDRDKDRPESDLTFNQAALAIDQTLTKIFFPLTHKANSSDGYHGNLKQLAPVLGLIATPRADAKASGNFLPPLAIAQRLWRLGSINFQADADGVGRRYALYSDHAGWKLPSLPTKVAQDLGFAPPAPGSADTILLAWRGGVAPYQRISFVDVYADLDRQHPQRPRDEFKNKIVLIGTDATSLNDRKVTPMASEYAGMDMLATAIDNLKNHQVMLETPRWLICGFFLLSLAALTLSFAHRLHALKIAAGLTLLTLISGSLSYFALAQLLLLPLLAPMILLWTFFFTLALHDYWQVEQSYQATLKEFGRYVNPHVVKKWINKASALHIAEKVESRTISVLFSDIRGFTTLSENRSPEQVVALLNRYFALQVEVIFRFNGTVDKFIGDCIMAFWGAPLDNPNHARDAVMAALAMSEALEKFKRENSDLPPDFDVGIGIHSGTAVVGSIGSEMRKEFTAIGDTVNLASRIEGQTKDLARILVSQETVLLCGDALDFQSLGSYKVKGREQAVHLFTPTSVSGVVKNKDLT